MGDYVLPKVKAKYAYRRQNEDELTFEKGAIIQLITKVEGGWYEGKYNGKIGWFPSDYVREIKPKKTDPEPPSPVNAQNLQSQETKQAFFKQVLDNFLETEKAYVKDVKNLLVKYIQPMSTGAQADVLSKADFKTLCGNLEAVFDLQTKIVKEIEETSKLPHAQQQVGQIFMKHGDTYESSLKDYYGNHPCAVKVILGNKEALTRYMEEKGSPPPGNVTLTSGLSKPFKRFEQYPNILRELERHIMENHSDRTYLTKAIVMFEKTLLMCQDARKRKETELYILSSNIQNWEGEPLASLGKVLYLSSALCLIGNDEKKERHLLLFPSALLILSASPRLSGFVYEGKLPLTVLTTKKLDDCPAFQHAFEITGSLIEKIVVITKSAEEQRSWLKILDSQCEKYRKSSTTPVTSSTTPSPIVKQVPVTQIPPPPKHAPASTRGTSPAAYQVAGRLGNQTSPGVSPPPFSDASAAAGSIEKTWCQMCLRPAAPCRNINIGNGRDHSSHRNRERSRSPKSRKKKKNNKIDRKLSDADESSTIPNGKLTSDKGRIEEEREILHILDLYCSTTPMRTPQQSIIPGKFKESRHTSILDEKIIVDDDPEAVLLKEKSLVDTVYELRDQVIALKQEQKKMQQDLDDETKARKKLETIIKRAAQHTDQLTSVPSARSSSFKEVAKTKKR